MRPATVIVEFPAELAFTLILIGLAAKVKSCTVYDTVVV